MSAIGGNLGLLVASLDLELVRLIRGAMAAADVAGGAGGVTGASGALAGRAGVPAVDQPLTYRAVDQRQQTPAVDLANARHPAATYERPRPVVHLPRVYDCRGHRPASVPDSLPVIQPPWKSLPWPAPPVSVKQVHRTIKVMADRTDVRDVGQMLDLFI